jgi:hypothetical protein
VTGHPERELHLACPVFHNGSNLRRSIPPVSTEEFRQLRDEVIDLHAAKRARGPVPEGLIGENIM